MPPQLCSELRWNAYDSTGADGLVEWWISFARLGSTLSTAGTLAQSRCINTLQ